jgi:hypothetical protein
MPANKIKIDNAILKRYKRQDVKRQKRTIICKILIVCEGTKTEPNYFKAFKKINRGTAVYDISIKGIGENTIKVVDKAIELRDKVINTNQKYDRVWAVFDKDSFSDAKFNGAIIKAKNNGIYIAWSNEAFELWYLYHFQNRITSMSRTEYQNKISQVVNNSQSYKLKTKYKYEKNCEMNYEIMEKYGSQENAIKWAMAKSKEYSDERFARHNPCTMVFKLVLQLIGKDKILNDELSSKI